MTILYTTHPYLLIANMHIKIKKHKIQNTEYKIQQTIYNNRVLDEGPVDPKVIMMLI